MAFMTNGRKFSARFSSDASRYGYLIWSAAQSFIYNEKVREQLYFDSLYKLIDETKRHCQPIRPECCVDRPEPDQKYAHLVDFEAMPWLAAVPSAILGIGAYRFYQAFKRMLAGIAGRPKVHPIKESDRVLQLTRKFFTIEPHTRKGWFVLKFGSQQKPGGSILFKAHREFMMPAMVFVKLTARGLSVSFGYEDPKDLECFPETEEEIAARLMQYSKDELQKMAIGVDRGVARPVQSSHREAPYGLTKKQLQKIASRERHRKRLQRRLDKTQKGSNNRRKVKRRLGRTYQYQRNVLEDFAHQTSHALMSLEDTWLIVLEALKIKNMVKHPAPKYDEETGRPIKNGASQHAGLAESILKSGWGKVRTYLNYKALKAGKLVLEVDPKNTSRRCPVCGFIDPKNRPSQAVFHCVRCGFEDNADHAAAINIRDRGIDMLLSGLYKPKTRKKLLRTKKAKPSSVKLGPDRADVMPVELTVPDKTSILSACRR